MTVADLDQLLATTSRTFALSIPLLPPPTRREVTVAYLLFRIADTIEDAAHWPAPTRVQRLRQFAQLLRQPSDEEASRLASRWLADGASSHEGYRSLIAGVPSVLGAFLSLSEGAIVLLKDHLLRSSEGMARFVSRTTEQGKLQLRDLDDLRDYCYVVAGIVGEMLTELLLQGRDPIRPIAPYLRERARLFGEGLQLVNILKDSGVDASEGRSYLPRGLERAEVLGLARDDLDAASEYVLSLQNAGAPKGVVGFTALPVELARATLDCLEKFGPGSKVTRPEVLEITQRMMRALDRDEPAVTTSERKSSERP